MALVLMAAPLDDMAPPVAREGAADTPLADPASRHRLIAEPPVPVLRARSPALSARARAAREPVPDVIFETRRTIPVPRERLREALGASPAVHPTAAKLTARRFPARDTVTVTVVVGTADVRGRAVFSEHQSP